MIKVFVSYSSEDRELVIPFIDGMKSAGFDVWWDVSIRGGDDWSQSIQRELKRSDCVVIFWSHHSVHSPWVRIEAHHAKRHNSMVPVRLDDVDLPDEYRMLQTIDSTQNDPDVTLVRIVDAIKSISSGKNRRTNARIAAFAVFVLLSVLVLWNYQRGPGTGHLPRTSTQDEVWKRLEDASTLDHLASVQSEFERLRDADPNSASGHAGLCSTYLRQFELNKRDADLAAAQSSCAAAAALDSGSVENSVAQGWLHYYTGDTERAIEIFNGAVSIAPGNASAWLGLGQSYDALGRTEEAEWAFTELTVVQPGSWRAQNAMALFLQGQGDTGASITRFELALQLAPENVSILNNLGISKLFAGDYAGAVAAWNRVLDLTGSGEHGAALSNIGSAYYLMRDFGAARNAFEKVTRLMGDDYRGWANLADTCRALGDAECTKTGYGRALDRVNLILSSNKSDVYGLASAASFKAALGEPGWQADLAEAKDLAPEDPEVARLAVLSYLRAGEMEKARAEFERCEAMGYPAFLLQADYQFDGFTKQGIEASTGDTQ
jgi:Flp pilus assembly protein TadD